MWIVEKFVAIFTYHLRACKWAADKKIGGEEKCMDRRYLATNETSQKFQIVEYMIWLSKVFGDVISFGSG